VASADEAGEDNALILRGALDAESVTGALTFAVACGALAATSGCVLGAHACCW
jgi:hypothetical protein